jgi:hypothetical protein
VFTAWRVALRMDEVHEAASGDGRRTYLRASASHEGIRVTIAATIVGLIDSAGSTEPPGTPDWFTPVDEMADNVISHLRRATSDLARTNAPPVPLR